MLLRTVAQNHSLQTQEITPHFFEGYLSSEENSYGVVLGRWFDGSVENFQFDLKENKCMKLPITGVSDYHHIKTECSSVSYYECLAQQFARSNFQALLNTSVNYEESLAMLQLHNTSKCQFKKICSPVSLPLEDKDVTICKSEVDKACFGLLLSKIQSNLDN